MRSLKTFAQYKLIYICIFWLEYVSHVNKPTVRRKCVPGFKLEIFSQINSGDKVGRVKLGLCLKRSLLRCSTQQETVHFDAFLTLKILPLVWVRELLGRGRRQDGWCPLACFKFTTHFPALFSQSDITLTLYSAAGRLNPRKSLIWDIWVLIFSCFQEGLELQCMR